MAEAKKSTKRIAPSERTAKAFSEAQERQAELADKPLGPEQHEPVTATAVTRTKEGRPELDPEKLQKEGASPADLEVRLPQLSAGPKIVVKSNPETPSPQQVNAALSEVSGPPVTRVTITDGEDNVVERALTPDDAALLAQRSLSATPDHPNFTSVGHWSNPTFPIDMNDEEREADQKAYAARVKSA